MGLRRKSVAVAILVGVLLLAVPAGLAVEDRIGGSSNGSVVQCRSTTHSFEGDAARLGAVHHHEGEDGESDFAVNLTVRSAEVDGLVLTGDAGTVANVSVSPGSYRFDLSRAEISSLEVTAKGENGSVLDRATVEYRCSEPSTAS